MTIRLDRAFLAEVGLADLPTSERRAFFEHVLETLEVRVGALLAARLSDKELAEFEAVMESNDDAAALSMLNEMAPDYPQVVAAELESLTAEIRESSSQILSASTGTEEVS